ncbi:MAG: HlyD family efflux transporter periplasmic adaptor subunit [Oscillospiraceae bacterium]|nr:HlyD family efflux transporter periplasmic adaptor subunit [Oscillospiraceae bacterium]
MEQKRREWVKNAAIIFLVIMLILTFFSNTIMNYSLPEVSAQYVSSGTLSEQIRGTATIEAAESYTITAADSRTVQSVSVKNGDTVEKGQVLLTLESGDSKELEAAQAELDDATVAYRKALLAIGADYSIDELSISNLEEDIAADKANLDNISVYQEEYEKAKAKVDSIEEKIREINKNIKALTNEQSRLDEQLTALSSDDFSSLDDSYYKRVEAAQEKIDKYEEIKATADKKVENLQNSIGDSVSDLDVELKNTEIQKQNELVTKLTAQYSEALAGTNADLDADEILEQLTDAKYTLSTLNAELRDLISTKNSNSSAETQLTYALVTQGNAEKNYTDAQEGLDTLKLTISKEIKAERSKITEKIDSANDELDDANNELADLEEEEAEAKEKASTSIEDAEKEILEKERSLEEMKLTLAQKQKSDLVSAGEASIDIEVMQKNISDLEEEVAELKESASGGEITAQVAGVIESIYPVAGETIEAGSTVAVIQMTEKGYTASITVTSDQAKKVKVGDAAEIQYFWYGDAAATLTAIKADTTNPATSKQLVFSVTGDVTPGQSIQLVMGGKGQQYDTIVPNSAVREDSNGKFVLAVVAKSSPLGNRYTAERVDITVVASDDTKSAVTGELMQSDFIISTSTKPINPGDQVRLVD